MYCVKLTFVLRKWKYNFFYKCNFTSHKGKNLTIVHCVHFVSGFSPFSLGNEFLVNRAQLCSQCSRIFYS